MKKKGPLVVLGYIGETILYSYYMGIISENPWEFPGIPVMIQMIPFIGAIEEEAI